MEKKFLLYILYITLIEIREYSYENKNEKFFWLADMMHDIPFQLETENDIKNAYKSLLEKVEELNINNWLETKQQDFFSRFPEFKDQ